MGYIEETLSDSEYLVARAHFHWTYHFVAWAALIFLGVFLIGIYIFAVMMIRILTTEVGVTNHRVVYKTGLITRTTQELDLDSIESIELEQTLLGRLFGYGKLEVSGTGIEDLHTPLIAEPLEFRKAIDDAAHAEPDIPAKGAVPIA